VFEWQIHTRFPGIGKTVTVHRVACFLERLGGLETSECKEACHPVNGYEKLEGTPGLTRNKKEAKKFL